MLKEPFLISVIVPAYNAQEHLFRCTQSVLNQRYSRLELMLVNNGSEDCTSEMCDVIATWDSRVKVIHQDNRGVSVARDGTYDTYTLLHDMLLQVGPTEDYTSYSNCVWNKLFNRELVFPDGKALLFDENISVAEDMVWLLEVVTPAQQGVCDRNVYYHYVTNVTNVTKAESRRVSSWLQSQKIHLAALDWLKEQGYDELYEVHHQSCERYWTSNPKQTAKRKQHAAAATMFDNLQQITDGKISQEILSDPGTLQEMLPKYNQQKKDRAHKSVKYALKIRKPINQVYDRLKDKR